MSHDRLRRVADVVRSVLSEIVQREIRDPRVGFVTLTDVKLSPDLRHALVFVSTLTGEEDRERALAGLNHAAPFLRRELATRTRLKHTPELKFVEDVSLERGSRVEALIDDIRKERADLPPVDDGEDP